MRVAILGTLLLSSACGADAFADVTDGGPVDVAAPDTSADTSIDASSDVTDAGDVRADVLDAGSCPIADASGAAILTDCVDGSPNYQAGAIPDGFYTLKYLRSFNNCSAFSPVVASGSLQIARQGTTDHYAMKERVTVDGVVSERYYDATLSSSGTEMTVTVTCGSAVAPVGNWKLFITNAGKTEFLVVKPPYTQRHWWVQQ